MLLLINNSYSHNVDASRVFCQENLKDKVKLAKDEFMSIPFWFENEKVSLTAAPNEDAVGKPIRIKEKLYEINKENDVTK